MYDSKLDKRTKFLKLTKSFHRSSSTEMPRISTLIRDKIARVVTAHHEIEREALKSITKSKDLSLMVRFKAQQALNKFPKYARSISIRDRCTVNGLGRAVIPEFKMNRIAFRELSLEGKVPGVKKSVW